MIDCVFGQILLANRLMSVCMVNFEAKMLIVMEVHNYVHVSSFTHILGRYRSVKLPILKIADMSIND